MLALILRYQNVGSSQSKAVCAAESLPKTETSRVKRWDGNLE